MTVRVSVELASGAVTQSVWFFLVQRSKRNKKKREKSAVTSFTCRTFLSRWVWDFTPGKEKRHHLKQKLQTNPWCSSRRSLLSRRTRKPSAARFSSKRLLRCWPSTRDSQNKSNITNTSTSYYWDFTGDSMNGAKVQETLNLTLCVPNDYYMKVFFIKKVFSLLFHPNNGQWSGHVTW